MEMKVVNHHSGISPYIKNCAKSLLFDLKLVSYLLSRQKEGWNCLGLFCGYRGNRSYMRFGYYQYVDRGSGMNIFKSNNIIIFINYLGWNLLLYNLAKQALRHSNTPYKSP